MYYFIDLEGVIIDSALECYQVTSEVMSEEYTKLNNYKEMFLNNRGLVLNAREYLILHRSIHQCISKNQNNVREIFFKLLQNTNVSEMNDFEKKFFKERKSMIARDLNYWLKLNPLTKFGKYILDNKMKELIVVTSKNFSSAQIILDYQKINYLELFGANEIYKEKNKGNLIRKYLDINKINKAIFIDDSVRNLDTCTDSRVKCFFADWGYGQNSGYELYRFE